MEKLNHSPKGTLCIAFTWAILSTYHLKKKEEPEIIEEMALKAYQ